MFTCCRQIAVLAIGCLALLALAIQPARAQNFACLLSTITGTNSTSCGALASVTGNFGIATGFTSVVIGNNASAYGANSTATGNNAVAVGYGSQAGVGGSAFGTQSVATGLESLAYGHSATANQSLAMALGFSSSATATNSLAVGPNASVTGSSSVALGSGASATGTNAVAIGSGSIAGAANTISVGSLGSERTIVNIANGSVTAGSKDAVNGGQLYTVTTSVTSNTTAISANTSAISANTSAIATAVSNALTANSRISAAFGGGSTVDANGIVTAPSYVVQGAPYASVGGALGAVDTRLTATAGDVATLNAQLSSGSIGMVRQDALSRDISIGNASDGTVISAAGSAGTRRLTGLAVGSVSAVSTDAVIGSQLASTNSLVSANSAAISAATASALTSNQRIASLFGGGSTVDGNGLVTAPSYTIHGASHTNVGSAFGAVDARLTVNTADISTLNTQVSIGAVGIARQDALSRDISIGSATDGTVMNITGSGGVRRLTGVQAGSVAVGSSDAVTGAQLNATNTLVTANTSAISGNTAAIGAANANAITSNQRIAALFGGGSSVDANGFVTQPSYTIQGASHTNIGSAFGAVDARLTANSTDVSSLSAQVASNAVGFVRQDFVNRDITIAATTDGSVISATGTAGDRRLTGLLRGTIAPGSSDAVTGDQLSTTNSLVASQGAAISANTSAIAIANAGALASNQRVAAIFGGGSMVDSGGFVSLPSYTIQGVSHANVGSAFGAVDARLTANTADISHLASQVSSGGLGIVRQDTITRDITIAAATDGSVINAAGTAGARRMTGLQAGNIAAGSSDAVTGGQLAAINGQVASQGLSIAANAAAITATNASALASNQRVASLFGGGSALDGNGYVSAPGYSILGSNHTSVGGAFGAVNSALVSNAADITALSAQVGSGNVGLVRQDSITRTINVAGAADGNVIDVGGTAGRRTVRGLQMASLSSSSDEAVTGAQLFAANSAMAGNVASLNSSIGTLNTSFGSMNQQLASVFGAGSTISTNGVFTPPSYSVLGTNYNDLGSAIAALNTRVQTNTADINTLAAGSGSGSGLVRQDLTSRVIQVGATTGGGTISMAGLDGNRVVTGVANGNLATGSTDAVNGGQLASTNTSLGATTSYAAASASGLAASLGGSASVDAAGNVSSPTYTIRNQDYGTVGSAFSAVDVALAASSQTIQTVSSTVSNVSARQRYMSINGRGNDAQASGTNAIAFGAQSMSSGDLSIAVGVSSLASASGAVAFGNNSEASGVNAIAIGTNAVATGSLAVGVNTLASNGGAAVGDYSVATGSDSAALGPRATATASNAIAIGPGAVANASNSVALGSGSIASVANTVSVGSIGAERRVTNVAAGVSATDAVNVGQLNAVAQQFQSEISRVDRKVRDTAGGVAMAMALAGGALPEGKNVAVGLGVGTFGGQSALGISQFIRINPNIVLSGGLGIQERQVGARAGMLVAW